MDPEELKLDYLNLMAKHESLLMSIDILIDETNELLYHPPDYKTLASAVERFLERIDEFNPI
jgi:hypothetical protein